LYVFSAHLLQWLGVIDWVLVQIDNSSNFDTSQAVIFQRLMMQDSKSSHPQKELPYSYYLVSDTQGGWTFSEKISICQVIFWLLLFEQHGQVVSSGCSSGRYLSLQDGFAYLIASSKKDYELLDEIKGAITQPNIQYPRWMIDESLLE
jgi:hypothetical protein